MAVLTKLAASNAAEIRAHDRAHPVACEKAKEATALDLLTMPATKRRATDESWNKDLLGNARARVEELKANINAQIHINSTTIFDADIAALHTSSENMRHEAAHHRELDASAKKTPTPTAPKAPSSPPIPFNASNTPTAPSAITQGNKRLRLDRPRTPSTARATPRKARQFLRRRRPKATQT